MMSVFVISPDPPLRSRPPETANSLGLLASRYGKAAGPPIRDAILETRRFEPSLAEQLHCLDGEHAIRTTTVGNDLSVSGQLGQPAVQLAQGYRDRARDVTGAVFLGWPDVEDRDLTAMYPFEQSVSVHGLHRPALLKELAGDALYLSQTIFGQTLQRTEKLANRFVGKTVLHEPTFAFGLHKPGPAQHLEML
jgi:hypothetical protein